jgi:putative transposase
MRPTRNKAAQLRQPKKLALHINQIWSMYFVADNLFDGRKYRMLTVVDCYTQEGLDIHVDQILKGEDVVRVLNNIVAIRGEPMAIKTDNCNEFISKVMDKWAFEKGVGWTSADQASTQTMPWWKASMEDYAKNV